jgi:hypothetical protein
MNIIRHKFRRKRNRPGFQGKCLLIPHALAPFAVRRGNPVAKTF